MTSSDAKSGAIAFSSVRLCLFGCLPIYDNTRTVRDTVTKFSGHHSVVEKADKFENGYVGVRGW